MAELSRTSPRWADQIAVVAATGPSLTPEVAAQCRDHHCIAVNDAYRLMPDAEVLYACDADWWAVHAGCPGFAGEKWTSHSERENNNLPTAEMYGLMVIKGRVGNVFSTEPGVITYGPCSGFQAINLAILKGAHRIVLVGFDMCVRGTMRHFFGDHPQPLKNSTPYIHFIPAFRAAAKKLPDGVEIINATPGSRLDCFPMMGLADALAH